MKLQPFQRVGVDVQISEYNVNESPGGNEFFHQFKISPQRRGVLILLFGEVTVN